MLLLSRNPREIHFFNTLLLCREVAPARLTGSCAIFLKLRKVLQSPRWVHHRDPVRFFPWPPCSAATRLSWGPSCPSHRGASSFRCSLPGLRADQGLPIQMRGFNHISAHSPRERATFSKEMPQTWGSDCVCLSGQDIEDKVTFLQVAGTERGRKREKRRGYESLEVWDWMLLRGTFGSEKETILSNIRKVETQHLCICGNILNKKLYKIKHIISRHMKGTRWMTHTFSLNNLLLSNSVCIQGSESAEHFWIWIINSG